MTDKKSTKPQYTKIDPSPAEKGKLGKFDGKLTDEEKRELLGKIRASVFKSVGSKHMVARKIRWFHRHGAPKAIKRKRVRRLMAKKSRRINAKKR